MQMTSWSFVVVLAGTAALAGCATPPDAIEAKTVNDARFKNLDCPMLITERDRRVQIRDLLIEAQSERYRADLISGALTGMTQSMINSPTEREAKIAEVKGELIAIGQEIMAKNCIVRIGQ
ncbi:type IV pilus biogenesis protein CpaD/CtpE [Mesorhizobium soli]|uniref:hypothetical protein n=1 Tax=Pseudaminobacter soli (ex Li et al. 2025) TaxID=1295366 RepID=UPI0024764E3B|nr:hypothetical protein [Mesorhizobium soli]MDH6229739.1 type IV pilus biogenesis protein CpaD/CtpE [Mesorhizobium soli]